MPTIFVNKIKKKVLKFTHNDDISINYYQNFDTFTEDAKIIFEKLIVVELPKSFEANVRHKLCVSK